MTRMVLLVKWKLLRDRLRTLIQDLVTKREREREKALRLLCSLEAPFSQLETADQSQMIVFSCLVTFGGDILDIFVLVIRHVSKISENDQS